MKLRRTLAVPVVMLVLVLSVPALAQTTASKPAEEPVAAEQQLGVASALAPSLARVEYTLQYDKGETPSEEMISQERPWEGEGFVLSPTKVLCDDFLVHPRFVKDISVRFGGQLVKAKVAAWGKTHSCALLELAEPLKDAKPLVFDASAKAPYLAATYARHNAEWTVEVSPLNLTACLTEKGRKFLSGPPNVIVTDKKGSPVGLLVDQELPGDDSWKGSPLDWPLVSAADMDKALADAQAKADHAVLRVSLSFRSPKKGVSAARMPGDEDEGTERSVIGVLIEKQKMLIPALMGPKATARLEKITVHPVQGDAVAAKFDCSLADYGAFLITLDKPLEGPVTLSDADLSTYRESMFYTAEVYLQGENRVTYFNHNRLGTLRQGWRRQVYPEPAGHERLYQFDDQGKLAIFPIAHRPKVAVQDRSSGYPLATAGAYLKTLLDNVAKKTDLATLTDPQNVPLTEQEENRLAWLGVELQPLNRELARANKVADLTSDGATGAMVSYVYKDSPADKQGIKMGDILLRLHVEGQPKPMDVRLAPVPAIPWEEAWAGWDNLREASFDRLPTPWQSAENAVTRALTDIGFGKKFRAEFFRDGNVLSKDFEIVAAPEHYDSAPRFKSDTTGLTVRNITYEVARYFQKKPGDPGVIISTLTPGSKGSVAGLKPFEIITHVNDKPVSNVKDFEDLIKGQTTLRLSVLRRTQGRTVTIELQGGPTSREGGATPE
jgi:hypothetical protein